MFPANYLTESNHLKMQGKTKIMQKNFRTLIPGIAGLSLLLTLMSSCRDEQSDNFVCGNTVIEAYFPDQLTAGTSSRTAIDGSEYSSGEIGVNWLPEDKIGVFGDNGSSNIPFSNMNSSENPVAAFVGNLASGEKPLYVYYPYSEIAGDDPTALSCSLPTAQSYNSETREMKFDWKVGTPLPGSSSRFKFEHILAFLKFEVDAFGTVLQGERLVKVSLKIEGKKLSGDFKCNLSNGSCTFSSSAFSDKIVLEWGDTPVMNNLTITGFANCVPAEDLTGRDVQIAVYTDRHIATFSVPVKADRFLANRYYTVPLKLINFKDLWTLSDNPDAVPEENAAWVPGLESKLACANTVYAIPGKPFMHKIRIPANSSATDHGVVPTKKGVVRAYNLPSGLFWNSERALVEGIAPAAGDYLYSVEFEINGTVCKEGIKLTVSDNLVSPKPMMGWQSWNVLEENINHDAICTQADAVVSKGLFAAGYNYIGIDDCWQKSKSVSDGRNADGSPIPDSSKFPGGISATVDYIHSKGLKAGIYSDAGTLTCEGMIGSYGYEAVDAATYIGWGFDMLKEDWFWKDHGDDNGNLDSFDKATARGLYSRMGTAFNGKMLLYMCEWGLHEPWKWASEAGSQCWRMSYDARDTWMGSKGSNGKTPNSPSSNASDCGIGVKNTIDLMRNLWPYVGINRYNDADMLCVGVRGGGKSSNDLVYTNNKDVSDIRYQTNFAMWCMYSSPLLLTLDLTRNDINSHDLDLLKNEELIAINQDPLCQGAEWVKTDSGMDYYMKDLANGDVAVAVVNLNDNDAKYSIDITDYEALDSNASYSARNLIAKSSAGILSSSSSISGSLTKHGTFIIRLTKNN